MWRRVSCEQPLDTSQSILRLRGSLDQTFGDATLSKCGKPKRSRKGIWSTFQNLVAEQPNLVFVVATQRDRETPTEALGRVVFSA
jgi:hypothetical protein